MRDYTHFDQYVTRLQQDVYANPIDSAHMTWAISSLDLIPPDTETVLDTGCGEGFLKPYFDKMKIVWTGLTLSDADYKKGQNCGYSGIYIGDFTFTHFQDEMFDLVYARHALEHSPFPIITLMEWHRIAARNLLLIAPAPEYWTFAGQNHYAVGNEDQLWWWLKRAGWKIEVQEYLKTSDKDFMDFYMPEKKERDGFTYPGAPKNVEYRYLCTKVEPITI